MPRKSTITITPVMRQRRKLVLNLRIEALQTMLLESHEELRKLDAAMDEHSNDADGQLELARKEA